MKVGFKNENLFFDDGGEQVKRKGFLHFLLYSTIAFTSGFCIATGLLLFFAHGEEKHGRGGFETASPLTADESISQILAEENSIFVPNSVLELQKNQDSKFEQKSFGQTQTSQKNLENPLLKNLEKIQTQKNLSAMQDDFRAQNNDKIEPQKNESQKIENQLAQKQDSQQIEQEKIEVEPLFYYSYRVKPGDMIGKIAAAEGITDDTLISVNHIRATRSLQIGSYLKIPSMSGILYTTKKEGETIQEITKKYGVAAQKCSAVNNFSLDAPLSAGITLFVPDAALDRITLQEINGDLFHKPIKSSWYLSSSFGWRSSPFTGKRSYHSGTDMACAYGTNVYAALSGRVKFVGFNPTYGNYIIISHHSGYSTLYGHLSQILCEKNQYVTNSTLIGLVGSTGMSTGPHLHFTVMKNGTAVNPVALWK